MPQNFNLKIILHKILVIISSLKWAWDFLLFNSFRSSHDTLDPLMSEIESYDSDTTVECAVCLCGIKKGEEVRELKCSHIFHGVCFDRWVGYGRWTCPLCRNHLKFPRVNDDDEVIYEEILVFNFCEIRTAHKDTWWLR
ncbi:hypothetical protein C2S53_008760 [Perilla frutescens var. hirtella]|uniref:RING-type domain-containing protein n=1 Tax=Perilla frutescens var. hirtella TaxID=608512 RepID=A0AAD4JEI7_PERFH|nr:hypothetical protein C2S51_030263 [Perilla frutescens var. frutescens]KAH6831678.1 hypothetical protein C2S53_008760 [Perilla frutescens var. hirtella]